jgi:hypothetical protein
MTPKRSTRAVVAVLLALGLAAAANGCEIIANFDTSLIPAEGGADATYSLDGFGEPDGVTPEDTGSPPAADSGSGGDTSLADAGGDSSAADSSSADTSTAADTGTADSSRADTSTAPDTGAADTGAADTGAPDTGVEDASDDAG